MRQYAISSVLTIFLIFGVTNAHPPKRVLGGDKAVPGEFPYQVSLRINGKHICGGAIIGKRHIISAAHCVDGATTFPYSNLQVVTGSVQKSVGQTHYVRAVYCHSNWVKGTPDVPHDIAVLKLAADIQFNPSQNKVALPTSPVSRGMVGVITGWGYQSSGSLVLSEDLMKLRVITITAAECQMIFSGVARLYNGQFCTLSPPGRGFCQGDSGGPLVHNNQLIGIVSYNVPCGKGYPDVFTSVHFYVQWIQKVMALEFGN